MGAKYSQIFPPSPKLTEKNLADQTGKVCQTWELVPKNTSAD